MPPLSCRWQTAWNDTETMSIEHRVEKIEGDVQEIAVVVMGTPRTQLEGGGRQDDGLIHMKERWDDFIENGGVPARVTSSSLDRKTKLWVAGIGGTSLIVAALLADGLKALL